MSTILLNTDGLCLRRFTNDDLDSLFGLEGDPEVMKHINGGIPQTRDEIREKILPSYISGHDQGTEFGYWAADDRETGEFVGWFLLAPYRESEGEIELAYRLIRSVWGQGLATEGSLALLRHGFTSLNIPRFVATAFKANVASLRVLEKAGLHHEEDFLYPEEILVGWSEERRRGVKYAANREAWLAQHPS